MTTKDRFSMTLGEAIFTQRAIRRFRSDPIPTSTIKDILEAAIRAPNGSNDQPWHFIVIQDSTIRSQFAQLYKEAWWAKRKDEGINGPQDISRDNRVKQSAMRLAEEIGQAPVIIIICATNTGSGSISSVIPATQNLLLAARSLGIGGTITTLHHQVEDRIKKLLNMPKTAQIVYCVPLGYPKGQFGPTNRKPLGEVCSSEKWDTPLV
jgi:nitroreductase